MGNAWSNPGPAKRVIIVGPSGELLVYSGSPAINNLILAASGQSGHDSEGNFFLPGLTLAFNSTDGVITFVDNSGTGAVANFPGLGTSIDLGVPQLILTGPVQTQGETPAQLTLQSSLNTGELIAQAEFISLNGGNGLVQGATIGVNGSGYQLGGGYAGLNYSRWANFSLINVASGSGFTQITSFTGGTTKSDFPTNPWSGGGVFTAPVHGNYDAKLFVTGAAPCAAIIEANSAVDAFGESPNGAQSSCYWSGELDPSIDGTLKFFTRQLSGATKNLNGTVFVARRES